MTSQLNHLEQKAQGNAIMQLLGQHSTGSDVVTAKKVTRRKVAEADWNVVIKNHFIEVVIPPCQRTMQRSLSDGDLPLGQQATMPWKSDKLEQANDMSDVSTCEADDCSTTFPSPSGTRDELGFSSEGEEDQDAAAQYQYMNCEQWMAMGYDMSMCFDPSWMQWMDPSMAGYEAQTGTEAEPDATGEWRTTVMIRNMPNNYTRDMLLELVDTMGFSGAYDFAYLPVDFQSQAGLGYAFINFSSVAEAKRCFERFEGFSNWKVPSEKVCTVTWSSPTQGLEAHIERYKNSPVMHHSLPDEWKPVLIQQGMRINFPPPSKPLKTPKVRQNLGGNGKSATPQFQ